MKMSCLFPILAFSMWFGLAACTRNFDEHDARKTETVTGMADHSGEMGQAETVPDRSHSSVSGSASSGSGVYGHPDDVARDPASVQDELPKCNPDVEKCPATKTENK